MDKLLSRRHIDPETGCWVWTGSTGLGGYGQIVKQVDNLKAIYRVHRLAAHYWLGFDLESKLNICHHCDNPPCFNPVHLFIATQAENNRDRGEKGRGKEQRGVANVRAKLGEIEVMDILKRYHAGGISQLALAREYGIKQAQVSRIVRGEHWTHLHDYQ